MVQIPTFNKEIFSFFENLWLKHSKEVDSNFLLTIVFRIVFIPLFFFEHHGNKFLFSKRYKNE